ncbi:MAG: hypothetical protein NT067_02390, partial [Candidatus Diapherotrites archaeon]|nr:hypothetical protein [Candidatus Diapherotrites archaeon]
MGKNSGCRDFAVFASVLLRDRILIKLSEFKLLFFSMMVSYAVYAFYGTGLFFLLSLAPLAVILFFCLTKAVPSGKARLLLYVWALLAWVGFCAVLLEKFFIGAVRSYLSPLAHSAPITFPLADYFFFGMSFFLLFSLAFYLYLLLPITGKNERFEQALKRTKEMAQAMVAKFDDSNANRIAA